MISRISTSMFLGICVTFTLFFFMQLMVITQKDIPRSVERLIPRIAKPREPNPPIVRPPPEVRPDPIEPTPPVDPFKNTNVDNPIILTTFTPPPVSPGRGGYKKSIGFTDGDIQVRAAVQPVYPRRPMEQGLEGYVVVAFDVTKYGGVINPHVLESSHSGFEKSALKAISRFKYKPRIIDGDAVPVSGVRYKFSFELEK